ncbi:MAG: DUF433 domain-containing protein [Nocardioidaceae bacterium]
MLCKESHRIFTGNLELLASGMSVEEVRADYPDLERDDLLAALEFAALTSGGQAVGPPGATDQQIAAWGSSGRQIVTRQGIRPLNVL